MSELQRAVRQLGPAPASETPADPRRPAPIPDSAGKAPNGSPAAGGGGDLTEKDFSQRTYWPTRTIRSTDGVISWQFKPARDVVMTDASGKKVVLSFAEPSL